MRRTFPVHPAANAARSLQPALRLAGKQQSLLPVQSSGRIISRNRLSSQENASAVIMSTRRFQSMCSLYSTAGEAVAASRSPREVGYRDVLLCFLLLP